MKTSSLCDAVILRVKGEELSRICQNGGGLLRFEFDSTTNEQSIQILSSSDASLMRTFHHVWVETRQHIDLAVRRGAR